MTQSTTIQNSFATGEISPSLFGRTDLKKYHSGASTMRNFYVNYRGGASSRAGGAYIGTCKQPGTGAPPRDIQFQFNISQGYALEFGDQYMRIKSNGAYILEGAVSITAITNANPGVVTAPAHGYANGDWVFASGIGGMVQLNGLAWIVTNSTVNTFELTDMFGSVVDTTSFGVYTSGGTVKRVYTTVAPYAAVDLPYLKFTQSADTMSLTCVNQQTQTEYPSYELVRNGLTNWVFTQTSFASSISAPTNVAATAQSSTTLSTFYSYVVTAVDSTTGDESIASIPVSIQNNDISINAGSNTITWSPVAGASSYNVYKAVPAFQAQVPAGTSYGFAGSCFGTSFTDTNITADFTTTPPLHSDPFARGAITAVTVTAGGANFVQAGIGFIVTTALGVGFAGTPIVTNGAFTSFVIENGGTGYATGDTILIQTKANGTYTFTTNPLNNRTIILNGVTWTFVTAAPVGNQTQIGATVTDTLNSLVTGLNASGNGSINVATYSRTGLVLNILYGTFGAAGNAYTLAAGTYAGVISSGTLLGGSSGVATADLEFGEADGTYPSVVAYFQQRRGYANTLNQPDTYFFSQPGSFGNFDASTPSLDDDAVIGAPWAQQINGIQFMQPMPKGLVILTGNGAWLLNGGAAAQALTPSSQQVTAEAYNGCNATMPPILINYDIMYVQSKGSIVRSLAYNFYMDVYTGEDKTIFANHLFDYYQLKQWAWAEEPAKVVWMVRNDGAMLSLTYLKEQDIYGLARHDTNGSYVGVCSIVEPPIDAVYLIVKRYVNGQWLYYSERMDNRNWKTAEDSFCVDSGLSYPLTFPNATLTPDAANGTNNISSVTLISGGTGYTAPTVTATDPNGDGTGATFSAVVSSGIITAINVLTEGQDYVPGSVQLVITDTTGSGAVAQAVITNNVDFFASSAVFVAGDVGSVIRIGNNNFTDQNTGVAPSGSGKAIVTSYVSPTQVVANIIEEITATLTDDPDNIPIPAIPNTWSMTAPVSSVRGLNHIEGKSAAIVADGSVLPNQIVTNGIVTLPRAYSSITIGLPYICQLQTPYLDPEMPMTIQGARKNINAVVVRVEKTRGLQVGTNQIDQSTLPNGSVPVWQNMKEIKERNALINAGSAIPLFTGDHDINVPLNWAVEGQVALQQIYPMPANVLAVIAEFTPGDTDK
jgi:hypothetical protein